MARYRHKSEEDLAWSEIRTRLTRALDTEVKIRREAALNAILSKAWDDYVTAVGQGTLPEIESKYSNLAGTVADDVVAALKIVGSDQEGEPSARTRYLAGEITVEEFEAAIAQGARDESAPLG